MDLSGGIRDRFGVVRADRDRGDPSFGAGCRRRTAHRSIRDALHLVHDNARAGADRDGRSDRRVRDHDRSVWTLRRRLGAVASATAGALTMSLGAATWITGNLLQLGGHRAVGAMANNGAPLEIANAIEFTVDMVDEAFELAGFTMVALGLACLAVAGWRTARAWHGWSVYTAAVAVVLLALVAGAAQRTAVSAADILLVVVGAAMTPVWLIWSRAGRVAVASPHRRERRRCGLPR